MARKVKSRKVSKQRLTVIENLESIGKGDAMYEFHYGGKKPIYVPFEVEHLDEDNRFMNCKQGIKCSSGKCLTRLEQVFRVVYQGIPTQKIFIRYVYFGGLDAWVVQMGVCGFIKPLTNESGLPMFPTLEAAAVGAQKIAEDPVLLGNLLKKTSSSKIKVGVVPKVDVIVALECQSFDWTNRFGGNVMATDSEYSPPPSPSPSPFIDDSFSSSPLPSLSPPPPPRRLKRRRKAQPAQPAEDEEAAPKRHKPLDVFALSTYDLFRNCSICKVDAFVPFIDAEHNLFCASCVHKMDSERIDELVFDYRTSAILQKEDHHVPSFAQGTDFTPLLLMGELFEQVMDMCVSLCHPTVQVHTDAELCIEINADNLFYPILIKPVN